MLTKGIKSQPKKNSKSAKVSFRVSQSINPITEEIEGNENFSFGQKENESKLLSPKRKYQFTNSNSNRAENKPNPKEVENSTSNLNFVNTSKVYSSSDSYWQQRNIKTKEKLDKIQTENEKKVKDSMRRKPKISKRSKEIAENLITKSNEQVKLFEPPKPKAYNSKGKQQKNQFRMNSIDALYMNKMIQKQREEQTKIKNLLSNDDESKVEINEQDVENMKNEEQRIASQRAVSQYNFKHQQPQEAEKKDQSQNSNRNQQWNSLSFTFGKKYNNNNNDLSRLQEIRKKLNEVYNSKKKIDRYSFQYFTQRPTNNNDYNINSNDIHNQFHQPPNNMNDQKYFNITPNPLREQQEQIYYNQQNEPQEYIEDQPREPQRQYQIQLQNENFSFGQKQEVIPEQSYSLNNCSNDYTHKNSNAYEPPSNGDVDNYISYQKLEENEEMIKRMEEGRMNSIRLENQILENMRNSDQNSLYLQNNPILKYREENNKKLQDLIVLREYAENLCKKNIVDEAKREKQITHSLQDQLTSNYIQSGYSTNNNNLDYLNQKLRLNDQRKKELMTQYTNYPLNSPQSTLNARSTEKIKKSFDTNYAYTQYSLMKDKTKENYLSNGNKLYEFEFKRRKLNMV